jgi:hypothetical protein
MIIQRIPLRIERRLTDFALAIIITFNIGLVGCAPKIKTEQFKAYADANHKLQQAAEKPLGMAYDWSRSRFMQSAEEARKKDLREDISKIVRGLFLIQDGKDPFGWKQGNVETPILPWKVSEFRIGMDRVNSALVQYAELLVQLASGEFASKEKFNQMANDLNNNLKNAVVKAKTLNPNLEKSVNDSELAFFSAIASTAVQEYIENKRKIRLVDALQKNQEVINSVAELGKNGATGIAVIIWQEYNNAYGRLANAFIANADSSVEPLLQLDERFIPQMQILHSLYDSYGQLPIAHQQLAASLESEESAVDQIQILIDKAQRLQQLSNGLKKSD